MSKNKQNKKLSKRPTFSKALMRIAKANLKEFELQTDEAFLVRAEIDRKLNWL